ncbi:MAG: T9SS type A sorting domain-containing protein [Bacteroidales bacterium]
MKKYLQLLILILSVSAVSSVLAQEVRFETTDYRVTPFGRINIADLPADWDFRLTHFGEITEGNRTYRQHLMQLKEESAARFPRKTAPGNAKSRQEALTDVPVPELTIKRNFQGNIYNYSAPNDNTLAVSAGNQLISATNTTIYFYDLNADTLMKAISLNAFSSPLTGISTHQYDPKVLYDPAQDRFIIVFLAGASSDTKTNIVVAFSESNDVMGNWNLYSLAGNPLNDTSWTDYPAIALTEDEFFITGNLLNYGSSWQTSFKQTVIWQLDKFSGYRGDELSSRLWSGISFDHVNIRNINPIQGSDRLLGPNIYLLSNRNFTLYSDSVFLLEVTGKLTNPSTTLRISHLTSDVGYGAPPDAKQPKTTNKLATNDARVLGGFLRNNTIQFVANSIDTTTGSAVIYHGIISNVNTTPSLKGKLITEPGMEFGYPNIAYTGNTLFSQQAIIGFNHTGDTAYPGVSAIFYDGAGGYSSRAEIKTGDAFIDIFPGSYERWGDYSGIQRKYNEPGTVWISGMFGIKSGVTRKLGTQIAEVVSGAFETPVVVKNRNMEASLYPNPVIDLFGMEFNLDEPQDLVIELRNMSGQQVHRFFEGPVSAGKHGLTFSTRNLTQGVYLLVMTDKTGNIRYTHKVLKMGE